MTLPWMNQTERAIFASCYSLALSRQPQSKDNAAHEAALEAALWDLECFRQAVRKRR